MGPPNEVGPRGYDPEGNDTTSTPAPVRTDSHFQFNGIGRKCRCDTPPRLPYADAWRHGFGYGFRDALSLLCREVDDPAVWTACHHLSAGGGDD
jgi:hypothetical protein